MSEIFSRCGQPWTAEEDAQLVDEYMNTSLKLMEIAVIHKRNPGGISSRLKHKNIIRDRKDVRGYEEYRGSELYTEACNKMMEIRLRMKEKKERERNIIPENTMILVNKSELNSINHEIVNMKKQITILTQNIQELTTMLKSIYEFVDE